MENKKHCLVAWTQKGQIRMIPSLINELAEPYRERIAEVETRLGRPNEAYQEFENAALVCTFGEDLPRPLLYRFLAMHRECLDLAKESKLLSIWYDMSVLRTTFRSVIRADED